MALAVKNASEAVPSPQKSPLDRLAASSLVGALYLLGSIGLVFYAVPKAWRAILSTSVAEGLGSFVDVALLMLVMAVAAIGLAVIGIRWLGGHASHGLKAGIFTAFAGILVIGWLTWWIGNLLEGALFHWFVVPQLMSEIGQSLTAKASLSQTTGLPESLRATGIAFTLLIGTALFVLSGYVFFMPSTEELLGDFEDQGWFAATGYKKSQGQRVRRGTILGILILAICGIYTLLTHHSLETGAKDWAFLMPFTGGMQQFIVLADVRFTVPLLLFVAALWLAYRIVNFPAFADFLIATEAELNKVSWTTRKRLVQDTIVVLSCVILFTVFLFVVDVLWGALLSSPWVGVLKVDPNAQQQQEQKEQPW